MKPPKAKPNRITEWRTLRGLTQVELAELVGAGQPAIEKLENGKMQLTEKWLRRLASALTVRPCDIMHGGDELTDDPVARELLERFPRASKVNRMAIMHLLRAATGDPDEDNPVADLTTPRPGNAGRTLHDPQPALVTPRGGRQSR